VLTRQHGPSAQGICATALKKVCRKLGIEKWPYKDNKPAVTMPAIKKSSLVSGAARWMNAPAKYHRKKNR
jgi:hypothetical protein